MDGLAEMIAAMERKTGGDLKPISVSDLDKGFDPIPDLKPGDKVRAKSERYNAYWQTNDGAVIIVHRVGAFPNREANAAVFEDDFTALFGYGDKIVELAFDSRRFERVPADEVQA